MKLTIPVYLEQQGELYLARPLFIPDLLEQHKRLEQALANLEKQLHHHLERLGEERRHDALARQCFSPEWEEERLTVPIALRKQTVECRFLFVIIKALGTRLAFTPSVPELWFAVERPQELPARAAEVLTHHFRELERKEGDDPREVAPTGRAWTSAVEVTVKLKQPLEKPNALLALLTGGAEKMNGQRELWRVGRCLNNLYPDELSRVVLRDREMAELTAVLDEQARRPVLLVGRQGAGKTALLHEYVYRACVDRAAGARGTRETWLLSPQRLIAGMSYIGQWQERVLAIAEEAQQRRHLLYFDNVLGLYHAGISRHSRLCVADVLKPLVEKGQLRIIAEMTPEEHRVFREVDRGFADMFHLLPVREMPEAETRRILIWSLQQLEAQHDCRFSLEVLPTLLDLQRRAGRETAFPGKAATFLKHLAAKCGGTEVTRERVLQEFHEKTGLALAFIDHRARLSRQVVIDGIGAGLIGQQQPLEAIADTISIAKARINDPQRPLASMLFLGPTGVGKTQCAKMLAAYLYGDAEQLIRIDLNEFVEPGAAARLIGTFRHPEGVLTAAVRNRPFAVVLFDEVEKANPEVFDLLLQVLGEGRLTDALGRTADFTNTIIILTSNLGVREVGKWLGFQPDMAEESRRYREAAERFFRPEFFNRLDRIIPFHHLGYAEIEQIARLLIRDVFAREGLVRRRCIVQVDPEAMTRVIRQGYHPQLGARALKRVIEQQLTFPTAAYLTTVPPGAPVMIQLLPRGEAIAVAVQALVHAEVDPTALLAQRQAPGDLLPWMTATASRLRAAADRWQPAGSISADDVRPEYLRYFRCKQLADRLLERIQRLAQRQTGGKPPTFSARAKAAGNRRVSLVYHDADGFGNVGMAFAAADLGEYLRELSLTVPQEPSPAEHLQELLRELALLQVLTEDMPPAGDRVVLLLRGLDGGRGTETALLDDWYRAVFDRELEMRAVSLPCPDLSPWQQSARGLLLEGAAAAALAREEEGTHLFVAGQQLIPVQVMALPLAAGEAPEAALARRFAEVDAWRARLVAGEAGVEEDPFRLPPVIRVYDARSATLDVRTGLLVNGLPDARALKAFLLARFIRHLAFPE